MSQAIPFTIHLATDHAGFEHKNSLKAWLLAAGYQVIDHGATTYDAADDFPDFIHLAAAAVAAAPETNRAFIFGGSGNGEAMLANRYPGVRAAVYYGGQPEIISLSRAHNDANILSVGARFVTEAELMEAAKVWLRTAPLMDQKYLRRNQKIEQYTKQLRGL